MSKSLKFILLSVATIVVWNVSAQTNPSGQAIVTIVGDPIQSNHNTNDFINTNSYDENNAPPTQQQINKSSQTIEPTLENGFHMRFEVVSSSQAMSYDGNAYASSSYSKSKRHTASIAETNINIKKRIKTWLPSHKKKYRPHLCGRF